MANGKAPAPALPSTATGYLPWMDVVEQYEALALRVRAVLDWINEELGDDADRRLDLLDEAHKRHVEAQGDLNDRTVDFATYMLLSGWKNPERFAAETAPPPEA
jgi:hypothetical protein